MSCADTRALMDAALDGAKPPGLAEHLSSCGNCAAEWARLVALERLLRAPLSVGLPEGFHNRVLARVDLDPRSPWLRRSDVRALLSVATVIAGFLLIAVGMLAAVHALSQPGELRAWLETANVVAAWLAAGVSAAAAPSGQTMLAWPIQIALALALALIWFGTLVLPRHALPGLRRH